MRRRALGVLLALSALGFWQWAGQRPIDRPSGILVREAPRQEHLEPGAAAFTHQDYQITPLARFSLTARVLSYARYRWDAGSALSPVDLALGWQAMSDSDVLSHLSIEQSHRWYTYRWEGEPPLDPHTIAVSSANMHMIPARADVARRLERLRRGHVVTLRGYLVEARRADGWFWRSSLTRDDQGAGACELVWVEDLSHR